MKKIAVLFTQAPHGSSAGREGLDALLAVSALSDSVGVFFTADGVFQLLPYQQPDQILSRNYITTFGVMPLYEINDVFICIDSLKQRGLDRQTEWVVDVIPLSVRQMADKLASYDVVLTF